MEAKITKHRPRTPTSLYRLCPQYSKSLDPSLL